MYSRPQRSAAKKAMEKIRSILKEECESEQLDLQDTINFKDTSIKVEKPTAPSDVKEDELTARRIIEEAIKIAYTIDEQVAGMGKLPKEDVPVPAPATATAPKSTASLPASNYKVRATDLRTTPVQDIKKYLDDLEINANKHSMMPDFLKYLIVNPVTIATNEKFRKTVEQKMIEFENTIETASTISGIPVTAEYNRQFKALSSIVNSLCKLYDTLAFDTLAFDARSTAIAESLSNAVTNLTNI